MNELHTKWGDHITIKAITFTESYKENIRVRQEIESFLEPFREDLERLMECAPIETNLIISASLHHFGDSSKWSQGLIDFHISNRANNGEKRCINGTVSTHILEFSTCCIVRLIKDHIIKLCVFDK